MTDDSNQLSHAVGGINQARTGAVQEHQILTINDQIIEHDNAIAANDAAIDAMLEQIKQRRRDTRRREKDQAKLRLQREIFARAAFDLKQIMQP